MKASALKYTILSTVATLIMITLVLLPFHAFLTVWLASQFGHYTALRLWKEVLLLVSVLGILYLLLTDMKIRTHTLPRRLTQLILLYGLVQIVWGVVAFEKHDVNAKALGYGLIINLRFLAFFLVSWSVALRTARLQATWQRLLLLPAVLVVVFGLLEVFVLPNNFLSHFGYNASTIYPYETINHNVHYIRIMSTLRGANPLGAYLIIPITILSVLLARGKQDWLKIIFLIAAALTLFFSFSRSAWIGAVISVALVSGITGFRLFRTSRWAKAGVVAVVIVLLAAALGLHHNARFQNIVFHTQDHSTVASTSDSGHASALREGLHDVVHQPLGRGPGSAGPASVYNNHPARIAENYFVQVGQETGWIGLLLFIAINAGVGYLLWLRRYNALALSLFASLIGLTFVNLLSHAWADDTLAYVWWGLAGIAMASLPEAEIALPEASSSQRKLGPRKSSPKKKAEMTS